MPSKIPIGVERKIVKLYVGYHGPAEIAKLLQVSRSVVDRVLKRNGVQRYMKTKFAALIKEKRCGICKKVKPLSDFRKASKNAVHCIVYSMCRRCECAAGRRWRSNNIDRARESERAQAKKLRLTNPQYRHSQNMRRYLREILEDHGPTTGFRVKKLIGCSSSHLVTHLESLFKPGMSWENRGRHGWHVDHKTACSKFDLTKPEERLACSHWTNLQPLWAYENMAKNNGPDKLVASAKIS